MALRRAVCACRTSAGFGSSSLAPIAVPMGGRSITVDVMGDDIDGATKRLQFLLRKDGKWWKMKHAHYYEPPSVRRVRIKENRDTSFRMQDIQSKLKYIQLLRDRGL